MTPLSPELADLTRRLAIGAGLTPPHDAPREPIDWSRWLELVREHDLAPFLSARAAPPEVAGELRGDYVRWAHAITFQSAELRAVVAALGAGDTVILKGGALAVTLYDEAAERVMSDFDLLFAGAAARDRAIDLLAGRGYRPRVAGAARTSHDLPVTASIQRLQLDLHVNFARRFLPEAAMADAWGRRVTAGGLTMLDPMWQALHAALHALADPVDSPLLRNLFEAGWLASRLDDTARRELVDRAERYGIADKVGRALALAHRLFGTPALLGPRRRSSWEMWAERRLSWRHDDPRPGARLARHLAEYHVRQLHQGAHPLDPLPLAGLFVRAAGRQLSLRLARLLARPPALVRAPAVTRAVGAGLLVHAGSGDVHYLEPDAVRVWQLAAEPRPAAELVRRLGEAGFDEARAGEAVAAMTASGLLVPAARDGVARAP